MDLDLSNPQCLTVVPLDSGEICIYGNYAAKLKTAFKLFFKKYGRLEEISREKNIVLIMLQRLQTFVSDKLKSLFYSKVTHVVILRHYFYNYVL